MCIKKSNDNTIHSTVLLSNTVMYGHQCPLLQPRPHSIGVNLAKILVGLELEHLGKPRTAKGCVGLGTEGDWIGVGYRLERGMKNVRYDKRLNFLKYVNTLYPNW